MLLENSYLQVILGIYLSLCFILFNPLKRATEGVPWYDICLAFLSLAICIYFAYHGMDVLMEGWMYEPPSMPVKILCIIVPLLVFEALRRVSGYPLLIICGFFFLYPVISSHMPSFLEGHSLPFLRTVSFHSLSPQSITGLPMQVVALIVIGYIILGVILMETGGGKFFLDFATALFGRFRGGTAKISIVSSGFFGSMSGAVIPNVLTTGSITIPAMKKSGFPPHFAGAVEACASSGGCLMPPIMGAAAFLMASFLEIPYFTIVVAAVIPSVLYYFTLFLQIDAISARQNIKGVQSSEIPPLKKVLQEGWCYLFALIILVFFLYLKLTAQAPFYTILFLLGVTMAKKETRLDFKGFCKLLESVARITSELVVILGAVGIIVGSLALTGVGTTFPRELIGLAGGNTIITLVLGALASYILGMGMTVSACYIFLAIVLAPGLVTQGFNPLAVHLFILYWGMVSYITPPVALAAYPAGSIAGAKPSRVGFVSMHLGFVKYVVPFIFVLAPALILEGSPMEIAYALFTAFLGLSVASEGLGRYFLGIGELGLLPSTLLVIFGLAIGFPLGIKINVLGIIGTAILIGTLFWLKKRAVHVPWLTIKDLGMKDTESNWGQGYGNHRKGNTGGTHTPL